MRFPTANAANLPQRDTARRAVRSGSAEVVVAGARPVVLTRVTRHLPLSTLHTWRSSCRTGRRGCVHKFVRETGWMCAQKRGAVDSLTWNDPLSTPFWPLTESTNNNITFGFLHTPTDADGHPPRPGTDGLVVELSKRVRSAHCDSSFLCSLFLCTFKRAIGNEVPLSTFRILFWPTETTVEYNVQHRFRKHAAGAS